MFKYLILSLLSLSAVEFGSTEEQKSEFDKLHEIDQKLDAMVCDSKIMSSDILDKLRKCDQAFQESDKFTMEDSEWKKIHTDCKDVSKTELAKFKVTKPEDQDMILEKCVPAYNECYSLKIQDVHKKFAKGINEHLDKRNKCKKAAFNIKN